MIRFITGFPARVWGWIIIAAGLVGALLYAKRLGYSEASLHYEQDKQDAKDADQDRADDIRDDARTSVRDDTSGYRD